MGIFGLLVFGPLALVELTSVQCFVDADLDVLASIISQCAEAWNDLSFIRQQIESKGRLAGYTATTGAMSPKAWARKELVKVKRDGTILRRFFQKDLAAIGIILNSARARHVFDLVAQDPCNHTSSNSTSCPRAITDRVRDMFRHLSIDAVLDMA